MKSSSAIFPGVLLSVVAAFVCGGFLLALETSGVRVGMSIPVRPESTTKRVTISEDHDAFEVLTTYTAQVSADVDGREYLIYVDTQIPDSTNELGAIAISFVSDDRCSLAILADEARLSSGKSVRLHDMSVHLISEDTLRAIVGASVVRLRLCAGVVVVWGPDQIAGLWDYSQKIGLWR